MSVKANVQREPNKGSYIKLANEQLVLPMEESFVIKIMDQIINKKMIIMEQHKILCKTQKL